MRRRIFIAAAPDPAGCRLHERSARPAPDRRLLHGRQRDAGTGGAQAVVHGAARRRQGRAGYSVVVLGFAGPAGGVAYNVALSEARAQQVSDQLVREGVARERIRILPRGPVPFEAVPTESRRVEIRIGG